MNLIVDSVCVECCESGSAEVRTLMHETKFFISSNYRYFLMEKSSSSKTASLFDKPVR
jgi:hypothetical protein